MARYIDADAILKEIYHRANLSSLGEITTPHLDWKEVVSIIKEAPTADVAEVVRCKDCGFNVSNMQKDPLDITDYLGDDIVCSYFMTDGMHPNDYCSRGKPQKEGEK